MSKAPNSPKRTTFAVVPVLLGVAILLVLGAAGGFAFAATQESHDSFCASCHTQPETTFFQNSTAAQPTDLAAFHKTKTTSCINCHSGQGILGRMQAELLGARNAFKWYSGTAIQPAVLMYPIGDQNCLKCHQNVTDRGFAPQEQITVPGLAAGGREGEGRPNHWHAFLTRWQTATPTAGTCVSCHSGHAAGTTAQTGFMDAQKVETTCNACHQVLRTGEG
jgi:nitrate/TMAO reductase-like tetraheme cytochrome c subunit